MIYFLIHLYKSELNNKFKCKNNFKIKISNLQLRINYEAKINSSTLKQLNMSKLIIHL